MAGSPQCFPRGDLSSTSNNFFLTLSKCYGHKHAAEETPGDPSGPKREPWSSSMSPASPPRRAPSVQCDGMANTPTFGGKRILINHSLFNLTHAVH